MKIIRHYPLKHGRRGNTQGNDIRKPKKKALLIGICYEPTKKGITLPRLSRLPGPLKDVEAMQSLLMRQYGYEAKDIVTLTDKDVDSDFRPTRAVILEQIRKLVEGAAADDHFFFHYSGHAMQTPNKHHSEEDDMDECLIPCDGENMAITDNELRRLLVDGLPIGSSLTAIFDSCHSESLLDLEHYRCNRVYVPWVSKGKRKSDTMRNFNVRQPAIDADVSTRNIYQRKRVSTKSVACKKTSIEQLVNTATKAERIFVKTKSLSLKSNFIGRYDDKPDSPIFRCDSPVAMFPCDGFCRDRENSNDVAVGNGTADVVSLSSCKDSQEAYETENGESMTHALIKILSKEPHPTLKNLMVDLSHKVYQATLGMHTENRSYKRRLKAWTKTTHQQPNSNPGNLDMANFQDPQLASHGPLDMDSRWAP